MNRRNFFQKILGFACGLIGIKSLPAKRGGINKIMEFEPLDGRCVGICGYHDKIIIALEYSIWELFEDNMGDIRIKLLQKV